jgi:hypothetical protein
MSTENAEKKNSRLWQAVRFTDPNRTKRAKLPGGFTATAVDANWVLERATELFGPAGQGFGWQIINAFETQNRGLATVHIRFWYMFDGQRGEYDAIASNETDKAFKSGDTIADSDAFKKALTDAVKNALTKIGFLADIHQGRHDDPEYVRRSKAYVEAQSLRDRAQQADGGDQQSDGDRDAETDAAPAQLTDEQRAQVEALAAYLTQEQIAEECNMNQSTVSRILSGALPKPNEELVLSVARLYSDVFFGAER